MLPRGSLFLGICVLALAAGGCNSKTEKLKVINLPIRTAGPNSMDPILGSTVYDNTACCQVYDTLIQYKYLKRPLELEPLLLDEMPTVSEDGLTYSFKLKKGILFHDDPCFEGGKGRELIAKDVFYSWRRIANKGNNPKCWWLLKDTILGLDEYRETQSEAETFDYDAPVEGMVIVNDHEFQVLLKEPVYRFVSVLAMSQMSIVPREAVEKYGTKFGRHPVGTGPFTMKESDWIPKSKMTFNKNPNFRDEFYPREHMEDDKKHNLQQPAGTKLPIVDRVVYTFFGQDQPMWLQFKSKDVDYVQVPAENFEQAFVKRTKKLQSSMKKEGIVDYAAPLLDFIFIGFNMEDETLGGYTPEKKALRHAISLALDWDERNDSFYNGINLIYDGMIPPGLDGHPEGGVGPLSYRGPNLERARELMVEAGYPNGEGLAPIDYYVGRSGNNAEQAEMLARQLDRIGIKIKTRLVDFPQLMEIVDNKKAPMFAFAWSSDYPDGENNLALFYSPNVSPGSNHFNYNRPEYDKMYESIRAMPPSEERTEIYAKMRDMVIEDTPYLGSMARTRFYLINPRLKNFKPSEDFYNWPKYLDVE